MSEKKNSEIFSNIRVEYENSVTVNTGNFQNIKPLYRISADVIEGVSPTEAKDRLRNIVDTWLDQHVTDIQREIDG